MALVAHSLVVGSTAENKIKGRQADALLAAYYGSEIALRMVQPGNENNTVTDAVQKVAESFDCKPISGMLSHELKQYEMDAGKTIIQNPTEAQKKEHEKCEFAVHEVYAIDVVITTGDGKVTALSSAFTFIPIIIYFSFLDTRTGHQNFNFQENRWKLSTQNESIPGSFFRYWKKIR